MKNIGIIIGVVVVVGVGAVMFSGGGENNSGPEKLSGTFESLLASGQSYECTFSKSDELGDISGHVYVAGEDKVYGKYNMTDADNNTFDVEVMRDGEYNYVWGSSPFGEMALKTKISEEMNDDIHDDSDTDLFESDQEFDFDCNRWSVDNSMFTPPSNIDFNEFMLPNMNMDSEGSMQVDGMSKQDICSSCDAAPAGVAREQCLQSLSTFGCN